VHGSGRAEPREIGVEVGFEFVEKNGEFRFAKFADGVDVGGIDERGALLLEQLQRFFHQGVDGIAEAEIFADNADARAA